MKVFKPSDSEHTLMVIARSIPAEAILLLRNESRNTTDEIELTCTDVYGYLSADFDYEFTEGASFEMTLNDTEGNLLYRGKAYATDQTDLENYKLTNG